MLEDVEGGLELSDAMNEHPQAFDDNVCGADSHGRTVGPIAGGADQTDRESEVAWDGFPHRSSKAMMYPAVAGTIIWRRFSC